MSIKAVALVMVANGERTMVVVNIASGKAPGKHRGRTLNQETEDRAATPSMTDHRSMLAVGAVRGLV